jgi:hypothetical protein
MRRTIIEFLTYPRMVMLSQMDAENCPLHLYFDPAYPKCRSCKCSRECQWLAAHDEFQALTEKPIENLYEAMRYCMDYVESRSTMDRHSIRYCACESCNWLRDAKYLDRQIAQEQAAPYRAASANAT